MYKEPIFLEPVFKERIWGGTKLRTEFGYEIPSDHTGECWGISAHSNGAGVVKNGPLQGKDLQTVWKEHKELFNQKDGEEFPLLVKLLDAAADLSVQVHPNDEQARQLEETEAYGKTECWYVVRAEPGSKLILGHHARTKEELDSKMKNGEWTALLREVPIQEGDFFYVPSGTIHAIGEGVLILETQQSSDTTYRVYDYDRTDAEGKKRELHLDKSMQAAVTPHQDPMSSRKMLKQDENGQIEQLVSCPFFQVYRIKAEKRLPVDFSAPFVLASVVKGSGTVETEENTVSIHKGDHFIIPATMGQWNVEGDVELITSTPV